MLSSSEFPEHFLSRILPKNTLSDCNLTFLILINEIGNFFPIESQTDLCWKGP